MCMSVVCDCTFSNWQFSKSGNMSFSLSKKKKTFTPFSLPFLWLVYSLNYSNSFNLVGSCQLLNSLPKVPEFPLALHFLAKFSDLPGDLVSLLLSLTLDVVPNSINEDM